MTEYLFVYGTLQPGQSPEDIASVVDELRPVGTGFIHGVLYDLGQYPAAVLDSSSKQKIHGTVFKLSSDPGLLKRLDEYEEFDPGSSEKSLFIRVPSKVTLTDGRSLNCWVYVYNRRLDSARVLEGGRFEKRAV
ncbi:MAG TPA: gamma-glutamylcyclotransferase family protein [Silvibacterium sp.]|nr:gamma-glutamylcyclotransferase family protein [Silvibacterium sp.]